MVIAPSTIGLESSKSWVRSTSGRASVGMKPCTKAR
jgi:hypothetical protein